MSMFYEAQPPYSVFGKDPVPGMGSGRFGQKAVPLIIAYGFDVDAAFVGKLGRRESFHDLSISPYWGTECKRDVKR